LLAACVELRNDAGGVLLPNRLFRRGKDSTMRKTPLLLGALAVLAASIIPGCVSPTRICGSACTYKSQVSFSGVPTAPLTSAIMEVKVTHSGACPQSNGPTNCTEVMTYDVACKLTSGSGGSITVPFFIDAARTNTSHEAKVTVVKAGVTTVHTGTVNMSSNVPGNAPPPSASMPTPCPPPTLNPYNPFPAIQ
jgi:hypothetical protein